MFKVKLPEMVGISGGHFRMGSDNGWDDEKPPHEVTIAYPFMMGQYPVTFDEYDAFCEATGRGKPDDKNWGRGRRPVINVSWQDAMDYCAWLSELTGNTYRLPNEAEWEYACRAGSQGGYCFGNDLVKLDDYAWYEGNSGGKTHPVGMKKPNAWGLYDMHGNVYEWCADHWHKNYEGAPTDGSAWESGGDDGRVVRGGCWFKGPFNCRAAYRFNHSVLYSLCTPRGFRVVCDVAE